MASKRKASAMNAAAQDEPVDPSDELMFLCLGGGNEVGRSCHIIQYKGKTVMVRKSRDALEAAMCPPANCLSATSSLMPASTLHTMASQRFPSMMTSISAP